MKERSHNKSPKKKPKPRSGKRPLRGETLVKAVRLEMGAMVNLSLENKEDRINVSNLAKRLGVSRQAIYDNLPEKEVESHAELQRNNPKVMTEAAALRRSFEERIDILKKEKAKLIVILDGWVESWAGVVYNAKLYGYDPDLLFAPMPPPIRQTLTFKSGRKRR